MRTIVEPKGHIDELWGRQQIHESETYRLMRYVVRVDYKGNVFLHNTVTGKLVILDQAEAQMLDSIPKLYHSGMEQLVNSFYLVPEDYDEHREVVNLRTILRKLDDIQRPKSITLYTILPTTACNARCYYCFEQGIRPVTMSEEVAANVVRFIKNKSGGNKVNITWFGGEPTLAANRIDQISQGLKENSVEFQSDMITNGYLLDGDMVVKAKDLWHLRYVQISVDGTEENYNRTKAYVGVSGSAYRRLISNIKQLLDNGIGVNLRMNFDLDNYQDFVDLVKECNELFPDCQLLQVYAYPVIGEYKDYRGIINHGTDEWIDTTQAELNSFARTAGCYREKKRLPELLFNGCEADNKSSITINAKGELVRCCEMFGPDQVVGTVQQGIVNDSLYNSWSIVADYEKCARCAFFPTCVKMYNCLAKDRCYYLDRNQQFYATIKEMAVKWVDNIK